VSILSRDKNGVERDELGGATFVFVIFLEAKNKYNNPGNKKGSKYC
jgi:hypothetical protein